jgi:hypothetical protein
MLELAIDLEDLRVLLAFGAILAIGALGLAALFLTPWRELEQPAGLEDWRQ